MTTLALDLADRSFDDLVEAARSRLPALAPQWTDYNLHDPGITLIELLAWTAEAQIYSLSRLRRDERVAYAGWLGVALAGPQPAQGIVWPDPNDPLSPTRTSALPQVLPTQAAVRPDDSDGPLYHPLHPVLLVPARLTALVTLPAAGASIDHTSTNQRAAVPFMPFGSAAGPRDRLLLQFECSHGQGLAARGSEAGSARLLLGVRTETGDTFLAGSDGPVSAVPLEVSLLVADARWTLEVVEDTTSGWLRSGWLALALPPQVPANRRFALEVRAPNGFVRPPRVRQIALNVVPIRQLHPIARETHASTGLPDQFVELNEPGLRVDDAQGRPAGPPVVEVLQQGTISTWTAVPGFDTAGPDDAVYLVDRERGGIRFGNGINGRLPSDGQILVSYSVCEGAAGNQPRPRAWRAEGLGFLGRSIDAFTGGADPVDLAAARGLARHTARQSRPLVTADDIEAAALQLVDLDVARAFAFPAVSDDAGTIVLVAVRQRAPDEPARVDETPRWLDAVRRALASRLPLGMRLVVRAPRYVDFSVFAELTAAPRRAPSQIESDARTALRSRLLWLPEDDREPRALGAPLTSRDVAAWLRRVDGVIRVDAAALLDDSGRRVERLGAGPFDLLRLDTAATSVRVARAASGASR